MRRVPGKDPSQVPTGALWVRGAAAVLLLELLLNSCASSPPAPAPGRATLWGSVTLVPREGVKAATADPAYRDVEFRDAVLVDYTRPGFCVVYLEGPPSPGGQALLRIEASRFGPALAPAFTAVGQHGRIVVRNLDATRHTVSWRQAGAVRAVGSRDEVAVEAKAPGLLPVFLLDRPGVKAGVFVAPGPFAEVSGRGQWELRDVPPGRWVLRVWHPRFPGQSREVELRAGESVRMDLNVGVPYLGEGKEAADGP